MHREDGPAATLTDGTKMWFLHDRRHRVDGPAVVYPDGKVEWWYNGVKYTSPEAWAEEVLSDADKPSGTEHIRTFLRSILKQDVTQAL